MEKTGGEVWATEVPGSPPLLKERRRPACKKEPGRKEADPYTTLYPSGGAPGGVLDRKTGRQRSEGPRLSPWKQLGKVIRECLPGRPPY